MSLQLEDSGVFTLQSVNSFRAQLKLSVRGKDHFITFNVYLLLTFKTQKWKDVEVVVYVYVC